MVTEEHSIIVKCPLHLEQICYLYFSMRASCSRHGNVASLSIVPVDLKNEFMGTCIAYSDLAKKVACRAIKIPKCTVQQVRGSRALAVGNLETIKGIKLLFLSCPCSIADFKMYKLLAFSLLAAIAVHGVLCDENLTKALGKRRKTAKLLLSKMTGTGTEMDQGCRMVNVAPP